MDIHNLHQLFDENAHATPEALASMQALAEQYPYCAFIYIQLAKKSKTVFGELNEKILTKTAIRVRSRQWLKAQLEKPQTQLEQLKIPDYFAQELSNVKPLATIAQSSTVTQANSPLAEQEPELADTQAIDTPPGSQEDAQNTTFDKKAKFTFRIKILPAKATQTSKTAGKKTTQQAETEHQATADATPQQTPQKKAKKKDTEAQGTTSPVNTEITLYADMSTDSTQLKHMPVSENMAYIYLKQKKYDKALEIFRKLMLNNPEKRDYFASLIQNVEKFISNP